MSERAMTVSPQRGNAKSVLVDGDLRAWHLVFLILVSWVVGIIGGTKATQHLDVSVRSELQVIAIQAIYSSIIVAFVIVVPELRRSLPVLFARPFSRPSPRDLALTLSLMLAWGYGLYRIGVCFPILLFHPEAYRVLGFYDTATPFELTYLVYLVGSVVIAPLAEELMFRGYLLNVWMARIGMWRAIIFSTLLFGLLHWQNTFFAIPLGFVFALVYLRYDSLWPGILLHALYNFLAFNWLVGGLFYMKRREAIDQISNWTPELVIGVLAIPLFVLFWRRFKPAVAA
jgi:membrane protease YdiL (CAAX protease family)